MILVYQSGLQIKRVIPDFTMLGATYLQLCPRPRRVARRPDARDARRRRNSRRARGDVVTEQIDALRMCAADPIDFSSCHGFLASIVMTGVLIVWAESSPS